MMKVSADHTEFEKAASIVLRAMNAMSHAEVDFMVRVHLEEFIGTIVNHENSPKRSSATQEKAVGVLKRLANDIRDPLEFSSLVPASFIDSVNQLFECANKRFGKEGEIVFAPCVPIHSEDAGLDSAAFPLRVIGFPDE